jgi:hypothetical protein
LLAYIGCENTNNSFSTLVFVMSTIAEDRDIRKLSAFFRTNGLEGKNIDVVQHVFCFGTKLCLSVK